MNNSPQPSDEAREPLSLEKLMEGIDPSKASPELALLMTLREQDKVELDAARAEIATLRETNEKLEDANIRIASLWRSIEKERDSALDQIDALQEQLEQTESELARLHSERDARDKILFAEGQQFEQRRSAAPTRDGDLRAENERLREALKSIAGYCKGFAIEQLAGMRDIACKALASPQPDAGARGEDEFTYCYVTCARKQWHLGINTFSSWKEVHFDRGDFTEDYTFQKKTSDLTDADKELVDRYGTPGPEWLRPSPSPEAAPPSAEDAALVDAALTLTMQIVEANRQAKLGVTWDVAYKALDAARQAGERVGREQMREEQEIIANKAREFAAHYPYGSDGRNTFVLLAEWIVRRPTPGPKEKP